VFRLFVTKRICFKAAAGGPVCPDCGQVQASFSVLLGAHKKVCSAKNEDIASGEGPLPPIPAPAAPVVAAAAVEVGKLPQTMVVPVQDPEAAKQGDCSTRKCWCLFKSTFFAALLRARQCWAKGVVEDALRFSREAIQFDNLNAEALCFRALLLNEKKQFEEAKAVALQSIQVRFRFLFRFLVYSKLRCRFQSRSKLG
jgi:hypothetical protein